MNIRSRLWAFTSFENLDWEEIISTYLIVGKETCPETGRLHYQGCVYYKNKKSFKQIQEYLPGAHLTKCSGNIRQNRVYCSKDGEYEEYGECPSQGKRSDLEAILSDVKEGKSMIEIVEKTPSAIRYLGNVKKVREIYAKEKTKEWRDLTVILLWGKTQTGKTRRAMEEATYMISDLAWWDGYDGDDIICIDEFRDSKASISYLLSLLHGYHCRLRIKGAHTYANWTKVFITSNVDPQYWYRNVDQNSRDALFARITEIVEVL